MYGNGPLFGFRVRGRSTMDIRKAAEVTRFHMGIHENKIDVESLLEKLPNWGVTVDFVEDDFLPPGVEACCDPGALYIYITNSTYQEIRQGKPRARFTAMHEIGHCFLAHKRMANRESSQPPKVYEDSEWQANQFAAEILMPLNVIRALGLTDPHALMNEFGVSFDAATKRLKQLRQRNEL